MQILEYHRTPDPSLWLAQIARCDWAAGRFLRTLLETDRFHAMLGEKSRLLLLTEGERLLAFCTYAERDDIPAPELTPWAGFVYTFPEARGKRRMGKLLEHVHRLAKADGYPCVYISTGETGLYEKYGCVFWKTMKDHEGNDSRIYRLPVEEMDYSDVFGRRVSGTVDRPLGSVHPAHPDMIYPVNYGCVDGLPGGDGEDQDVYILGPDKPMQTFAGTVIGVYHRLNDREDKWIVTPDGSPVSRETILEAIAFQEQFFMGELYLPEKPESLASRKA